MTTPIAAALAEQIARVEMAKLALLEEARKLEKLKRKASSAA